MFRYFKYLIRRFRSEFSQPLIGSGYCRRCKLYWRYCKEHTTYSDGRGLFALCEDCWSDLTPEKRLPYYWYAFEVRLNGSSFIEEHRETWLNLTKAVMEGK